MNHSRWGFRLNWGKRRDQLADLERMLNLLDGKPVPENRNDLGVRLEQHIDVQRTSAVFEDDYFSIRYFQKGSAHITFVRSHQGKTSPGWNVDARGKENAG